MLNKCSNCAAPLVVEQTECPYCGCRRVEDFEEMLLSELINIDRRYEAASAQGDKVTLDRLLADEFVLSEVEDSLNTTATKTEVLARDDYAGIFFSYTTSEEKLMERAADSAVITYVGNLCFHYPPRIFETGESHPANDENLYARVKSGFIKNKGKWRLSSKNVVYIDVSGNPF